MFFFAIGLWHTETETEGPLLEKAVLRFSTTFPLGVVGLIGHVSKSHKTARAAPTVLTLLVAVF